MPASLSTIVLASLCHIVPSLMILCSCRRAVIGVCKPDVLPGRPGLLRDNLPKRSPRGPGAPAGVLRGRKLGLQGVQGRNGRWTSSGSGFYIDPGNALLRGRRSSRWAPASRRRRASSTGPAASRTGTAPRDVRHAGRLHGRGGTSCTTPCAPGWSRLPFACQIYAQSTADICADAQTRCPPPGAARSRGA